MNLQICDYRPQGSLMSVNNVRMLLFFCLFIFKFLSFYNVFTFFFQFLKQLLYSKIQVKQIAYLFNFSSSFRCFTSRMRIQNELCVFVHQRALLLPLTQSAANANQLTMAGQEDPVQREIHQDWANREYIEVITSSIKKIADFLNSFGKTGKLRLVVYFYIIYYAISSRQHANREQWVIRLHNSRKICGFLQLFLFLMSCRTK